MCEAPVTNPCFDGAFPHTVYKVLSDCQVIEVTLSTDTVQEAEDCRQLLVAELELGQEICPLDEAPPFTQVCKEFNGGYDQLYFQTCSSAQLAICEQQNCEVDCMWTEGECP
jgi:hypothetical protein